MLNIYTQNSRRELLKSTITLLLNRKRRLTPKNNM